MELIHVSMTKEAFLNILSSEFDSYEPRIGGRFESVEARDELKELFLAMNESFCDDGIGGLGTCDSVESYVNAFIYTASWGYIVDYDGEFESEEEKLEYLRNNSLYVDENLGMYVEYF